MDRESVQVLYGETFLPRSCVVLYQGLSRVSTQKQAFYGKILFFLSTSFKGLFDSGFGKISNTGRSLVSCVGIGR